MITIQTMRTAAIAQLRKDIELYAYYEARSGLAGRRTWRELSRKAERELAQLLVDDAA